MSKTTIELLAPFAKFYKRLARHRGAPKTGPWYSLDSGTEHEVHITVEDLKACAEEYDRLTSLGQMERTPDQIRLEPFFEMVADKKDWKRPIDATVKREVVKEVVEAVQYYTATECEVVNNGDGTFRVISIGYRRGPAGDH